MFPSEKYYLKIGKASDLKSPKERWLYRAFEILPGALAWLTLLSVITLSYFQPIWVAFFIITFDIYWLLKTIYLSFHLRAGYNKMKRNMEIDWLVKLKSIPEKNWQEIYHLIILPAYKESVLVVSQAIEAVIDCDYPKDKMIMVLAIEKRAGESAGEMARLIEDKFSGKFFKFLIAIHPDDIIGEQPGKGSNSVWAARQTKEKIIDPLKIPYANIIVSCFDIDTQIYPKYFSCLTYHYLIAKKPTRSSYQPIPIYNNNIWQAPAISRVVAVSATFWQMMQQERKERLSTFSSQSISFQALADVDFWQTNMVSEDSRIFWQCLLFYEGDYRTVPLHYPVSMDANLAPSFWRTAINIYKQQRRWGWGAENIPYLFFGFYKDGWRNGKISLRKKIRWVFVQLEGFWSWSTNAILIFLLGWLPLYLGGSRFNTTLLSYNLPRITRIIMTIAMIGLVGSAIYSTLLLPKKPKKYKGFMGFCKYCIMILQWILVPLTIMIFGALPGLEAQTRLMLGKYMGFWATEKHRNL